MDEIFKLLNPHNTVNFNRPLAHALGTNEAIIYSALIAKQVYYEQREMLDGEGWFYSTVNDLEESTALTKRQQCCSVKVLVEVGLIKSEKRGMPARRCFRVVKDVEFLKCYLEKGTAKMLELNPIAQKSGENVLTSGNKIARQVETNSSDKSEQNVAYTYNYNNKSKIKNQSNQSIDGNDRIDNSTKSYFSSEERAEYLQLIRENIEYDYQAEKEKVDELVAIMLDVVCSTSSTVRVNGEDMPQEIVKSRFLKLNSSHIDYVLIPVTVLNPDKLQYAADGLVRAKIPHVAESTTLYVPDYAVKTLREILSHYTPLQNFVTIREQITLDIDRLIYSSIDFDDLLAVLKEQGYEVKQGKYIAVKHPNAERFVRLKSLGDDYCQGRLEQRISNRNDFANSTNEKIQTATYTERIFYIEILSVTAAVKELRLEPKKTDKAQIYTFHNDADIDYLVKQLNTIAEFGLTDRESIVRKGCEIMENINEIRAEGNNPAPERERLARINELLKAYDELIEGNYIDNLIKAQKQQQTVQQPKATPKKHNRK